MIRRSLLVSVAILFVAALNLPAADEDKDQKTSLDVRFSRVRLQCAETNLERYNRLNEKNPNTVTADVISGFAQEVEIARTELKEAELGSKGNPLLVWIQRAESNLRSTEAFYKHAKAANQRAPGIVDPLELKRLELQVEMARLQIERGQALANAPPEARLRWQIGVLSDELDRLKEQTSKFAPVTRIIP